EGIQDVHKEVQDVHKTVAEARSALKGQKGLARKLDALRRSSGDIAKQVQDVVDVASGTAVQLKDVKQTLTDLHGKVDGLRGTTAHGIESLRKGIEKVQMPVVPKKRAPRK
ncbi:MAG: hypothetical protein OXQ29_00255, partial [Rhodospirillaceae bacterium]|nr:hypothetical protein [Rhodospirillaceae bacterium]